MAPSANPFGNPFQDVCRELEAQLVSLYNQLNRRQELSKPQFVSLLNCNALSNITRTIIDIAPEEVVSGVATPPSPKITLDFSEPGPSMDLNFNIYAPLTGTETAEQVAEIVVLACDFWGFGEAIKAQQELTPGFWQVWGQAVNKAAIQLENDLVVAMRNGRQGTQAVHDFIPKPGIFLSAPTNATSGLVTAEPEFPGEGPIGEGPGGDFPEHGGPLPEIP